VERNNSKLAVTRFITYTVVDKPLQRMYTGHKGIQAFAQRNTTGGYSLTLSYRSRIVVVNFVVRPKLQLRYALFTKRVAAYGRRKKDVKQNHQCLFTFRIDRICGSRKI